MVGESEEEEDEDQEYNEDEGEDSKVYSKLRDDFDNPIKADGLGTPFFHLLSKPSTFNSML